MTDAERRLWYHLRRDRLGVRFYRQRVMGAFIVDFYSPRVRLIIEVDGAQHFKHERRCKDKARDQWLKNQGLQVLRFNNRDVLLETTHVVEEIYRVVCRRAKA
jgi:very-short-patch-repair endonuclease